MTAADIEPDDAPDLGDIAEDLLHKAATAALALSNEPNDPATNALIAQVLALAGAGYAQLAGIDFAQEQGNRQASLFGELLAEWRASIAGAQQLPQPRWPDLVISGDGGQWRYVADGSYVFEGLDETVPVTLAELRAAGATREYVLRPRPGDG